MVKLDLLKQYDGQEWVGVELEFGSWWHRRQFFAALSGRSKNLGPFPAFLSSKC
jgi:hypothetical protein